MERDNFEILFRKYSKIWVWSILFGANTGLTYSLASSFPREDWGILGLAIVVFCFYGIILVFTSWINLYKFFKSSLLPILFVNKQESEIQSGDEIQQQQAYLAKAFQFMIFASVIVLSSKLIEILLTIYRFK